MPSVCYQLLTAQTASGPGVASLAIVRDCRMYGFLWAGRAAGGAGIGYYSQSLELNNTGQTNADTNNPNRNTIIGRVSFSTANAGTGSVNVGAFVPVDIALKAGDVLSINQTQTGTAAGSQLSGFNIYCTES